MSDKDESKDEILEIKLNKITIRELTGSELEKIQGGLAIGGRVFAANCKDCGESNTTLSTCTKVDTTLNPTTGFMPPGGVFLP